MISIALQSNKSGSLSHEYKYGVYGNGVNRLSENGIEWKKLLMDVSGLHKIPTLNNNTMLYEYIVLPEAVPLATCDGKLLFFSNGEPWLVKNEPEEELKSRLKGLLSNR